MISYIHGEQILERHDLPNAIPREGELVRIDKESYVVEKLLWNATNDTVLEVYLREVNNEDVARAIQNL